MIGDEREAKLRYLDASIDILREGDYVVCAVTGRRIQLGQLRYWSVDRQEAYASAEIAAERHKATEPTDDAGE